jgi:hypothetical protein
MNCQVVVSKVARLSVVLTFLIVACFAFTSGCGGGDGTVASQNELSTFLEANPELNTSSASEDEGKARESEASEAPAPSRRTDA